MAILWFSRNNGRHSRSRAGLRRFPPGFWIPGCWQMESLGDFRDTRSTSVERRIEPASMSFLRKPMPGLIHHSDRGSQYAGQVIRAQLEEYGLVCPISRKGNVPGQHHDRERLQQPEDWGAWPLARIRFLHAGHSPDKR
jgi:transposase InsO family protein